MSLSQQYDAFYRSALIKEQLPEVVLRGWPRKRVEAILHSAGEGGVVLDVRCGKGHHAPLLSGGVQLVARKAA